MSDLCSTGAGAIKQKYKMKIYQTKVQKANILFYTVLHYFSGNFALLVSSISAKEAVSAKKHPHFPVTKRVQRKLPHINYIASWSAYD